MNKTDYTRAYVLQTWQITSITRQGGEYLSEMPENKKPLPSALVAACMEERNPHSDLPNRAVERGNNAALR